MSLWSAVCLGMMIPMMLSRFGLSAQKSHSSPGSPEFCPIPDDCHWADVRVVTTNVGQALQRAMHGIEKANPETLYGIFGDAQRGTFGTYFRILKRHGLLTVSAQGDVEITPAGLAYLGSDVPPPPRATAFPLRFLALVWITPAAGSTRVSANLRCLRASLSWHTWVAARPSAASRARCGRSARA
jgi:hypothetical protein